MTQEKAMEGKGEASSVSFIGSARPEEQRRWHAGSPCAERCGESPLVRKIRVKMSVAFQNTMMSRQHPVVVIHMA